MCAFAGAGLVRRPLNAAVVRNSLVTLECTANVTSSEGLLQWFNVTSCVDGCAPSTTHSFIYHGSRLISAPPTFSVTEVDNATHATRNLNINSAELTDAGAYQCAELITGRGYGQWSIAQLIVLGNALIC